MKAGHSNKIVIAANNGDVGGGEVMLLALAEELAGLGMAVTVVGPSSPAGLVDASRDRNFDTVVLDATARIEYLRVLRRWDRRHRDGVLWCNGLLPAMATAGHRNRIVHLHQRPRGKQRPLVNVAGWGSLVTLVPSADMAAAVRGATILHNWVADLGETRQSDNPTEAEGPIRIGFLGRPSVDKGIEVLVEAMHILNRESPGAYRLVLGGESRFVRGASRASVETALASLGSLVDRTGWIAPRDFFRRIDVLVSPSIWPESFGLVVAESMSARVPVVVTDVGALPEVVGTDHPWIARAGDAEDLASKMRQAAEGDVVIVDRAYERWFRKWSAEAGRERLALLLKSLGFVVRRQ